MTSMGDARHVEATADAVLEEKRPDRSLFRVERSGRLVGRRRKERSAQPLGV